MHDVKYWLIYHASFISIMVSRCFVLICNYFLFGLPELVPIPSRNIAMHRSRKFTLFMLWLTCSVWCSDSATLIKTISSTFLNAITAQTHSTFATPHHLSFLRLPAMLAACCFCLTLTSAFLWSKTRQNFQEKFVYYWAIRFNSLIMRIYFTKPPSQCLVTIFVLLYSML